MTTNDSQQQQQQKEKTMEPKLTQYTRPVVVPLALTGAAAAKQAEQDEAGKLWWDKLDTLATELDSAFTTLMANPKFEAGLAAKLATFQACSLDYLEHVATEVSLVTRWQERGELYNSAKLAEKLHSSAHSVATAYYTALLHAGVIDPERHANCPLVEFWRAMAEFGC